MQTQVKETFGGRSLSFMRILTRGKFPHAASCKALYVMLKDEKKIRRANKEPDVGALMLWPTVSEYGDCTMYLGNKRMLLMHPTGTAMIVPINYYGNASFYVLDDALIDL